MFSINNKNTIQHFRQLFDRAVFVRSVFTFIFSLGILAVLIVPVYSQSNVTGGFEGRVTEGVGGAGIAGVTVQFTNTANGFQTARKTNADGYFQQDFLSPGIYTITVNVAGYEPYKKEQELYATRSNRFLPAPIPLTKIVASTVNPTNPTTTPTPAVTANTDDRVEATSDTEGVSLNPRRDGAFNANAVSGLPLGGTTLTRTFDELAFLIPGVMPPPQAIGNSVGPGIGGGVGTSGQFSVNGLRSRANNFTVDGSDNNDEDIGVRRQGFFTLVPQPIESIQEFQIITLLAPAQYGRNLGAQVNAISKQGGNRFSGSIFGLLSFDRFNAPSFFDNTSGDTTTALTGRRSSGTVVPVFVDGQQKQVFNDAGEKDVFTLLQGGFAVGGRIVKDKMFFFVSGEGQYLDGTKEANFAVPTVAQRGLDTSGVSGLQQCQINSMNNCIPGNFVAGFPTSVAGDAVFSLFPFPNNPAGIYGRNTYTQALSTDAKGLILSGRYDWNNIFKINGNPQNFTARYNYTDDKRDLTDVGGALFSSIRPLVRTDNFSTFLTGSLTDNISNELRFSWGRTQLEFEEIRDTNFLVPISSSRFRNRDDARFLLNAPLLFNNTFPTNCNSTGCFAPSQANYSNSGSTTEFSSLGPIGQLIIAGFSPVGVDVFNFPQERKNDTFQLADTVRWQIKSHSFSFGADVRRTYLDSDLPRNSRPLVTFNGGLDFRDPNQVRFTNPLDLAAAGGATGFFQSLVLPGSDSRINLSYYQFNFFIQDEWRVTNNFVLNFGLRYEYNTPPKEADSKIEKNFQLARQSFPEISNIDLFRGFSDFFAGRTKIYDSDFNNFAPRISFAWSPFTNNKTVIRGGYGIYYDQIIGAVVSQSRNVFPTFSTINTAGGEFACSGFFNSNFFTLLNPITGTYSPNTCPGTTNPNPNRFNLVQPGTLNTLNPQFRSRLELLQGLLGEFPFFNGTTFGATIPTRELEMPMSHQYSIGVEQEIFKQTFLSVAYVGTLGRKLLRFTTPNLGNNFISLIDTYTLFRSQNCNPAGTQCQVTYTGQPSVIGTTVDPFSNANFTRPNRNIGPINQFETTGNSRYDSLQIGLRGRLTNNFQYQMNYVYGKVEDDVSDVFDLAGASALPQNSLTFAGEYAPANFDVRHRFTYNFVYNSPSLKNQNDAVEFFFGGWQISGTGKFNTGQPFTVNSIFDVNHDGNLTDRLNSRQFITETGNNQNPLQLTCTTTAQCSSMLAPFGRDGAVGRNSFRAGNLLELDLSFAKRWTFRETQSFQFRVDVFNFIDRANFAIPVRFLEAPGFGSATDTVTPGRRIQFNLKYSF